MILSRPYNRDWFYDSTIARFDPVQNSWTILANLQVARRGHGVIQVDNEFIVVGGTRNGYLVPTESCKFSDSYYSSSYSRALMGDPMACITREPQLSDSDFYPELMLIP